ncbi:zinc dependent phospholipase C family protein [Hippea sp. KM1]|uniref:zinc dependent phospholipase C family protein n=1 Tax=Hippea sp. KM1 TaxID=944481 RepID=UPI00046CA796|nr:zinc dependent phospholipase C family protein [Hippea sp. KM1]
MSRFFLILFTTVVAILTAPKISFAWGPSVHIGISLASMESLPNYLKLLLASHLNEYLYGCLAPDFIVGKSFSHKDKHSHNWKIGFSILNSSDTDKQKAFALGYLSHLAADSVAHGIMAKNLSNIKHLYLESLADAMCENSYKKLAKRIMSRYNSPLDTHFKEKVDTVLFSFGVSKLIFKGIVRATSFRVGEKGFQRILLNKRLAEVFSVDYSQLKNYIELSKEFTIDVLTNGESSSVVNISAISE